MQEHANADWASRTFLYCIKANAHFTSVVLFCSAAVYYWSFICCCNLTIVIILYTPIANFDQFQAKGTTPGVKYVDSNGNEGWNCGEEEQKM